MTLRPPLDVTLTVTFNVTRSRRSRRANQGGEMPIAMRRNMTLQLARSTGDRICQRRRERGVQHGFTTFEKGSVQRSESRCAEGLLRFIKSFIWMTRMRGARPKIPAQVLQHRQGQRRRELLVERLLIERHRGPSLPRHEDSNGPCGQ